VGELMYRRGREARGIGAEEESEEKLKQKKKVLNIVKVKP
jgi:hypothetical protein